MGCCYKYLNIYLFKKNCIIHLKSNYKVDNEHHSDFTKLKETVLKNNMQDLIEKTQLVHYELYRSNRLIEMGFLDTNVTNGKELSIAEIFEAKHADLKTEMQKREETIKESFVAKVKSKETELKEIEKNLHDRHLKVKQKNAEQKDKLEVKKQSLESEKKEFQRRKSSFEQSRLHSLATLKPTKKK
jgi:septin family protein